MSKKKLDKKIPGLEANFNDIFVCQKNNLRPYMEIFIQKPENISQQNLGTLAGVLEVSDESEESSYVVNYLISIIKKEYFQKTKRGAVESFEAALRKANSALAKLAEHENLGWLGKINSVILVIEKNNLHIAQTGNTCALMLRGKSLTNISEGTPEESVSSPLKTFIDVISGRIEKNDQLIISTQHIFEIFSLEEIKKSALRFSFSELNRFLKTALINELERAAVLTIEIKEEEREKFLSPLKKSGPLNAFSQTAFAKKGPSEKVDARKEDPSLSEKEKIFLAEEIKKQLAKNNGDFTDKKTGHIYIKEDHFPKEEDSFWNDFLQNTRQKVSSLRQFEKPPQENATTIKEDLGLRQKTALWLKIKPFLAALLNIFIRTNNFIWDKTKKIFFRLIEKIRFAIQRFQEKKVARASTENAPSTKHLPPFSFFLPKLSRLKNIFLTLNFKQKLYALLAVALLLIIPYFINKFFDKQSLEEDFIETPAPINLQLENDKNVIRLESLTPIHSGQEVTALTNLNDKILALSGNQILDLENGLAHSLPEGFSSVKMLIAMNDLNLLFLLNTENKILSFSPVSKKFETSEIVLPTGIDLACAQTYLTYLYLLDTKHNQIYRYPRAGLGFGEKIDWLKDSLSLSEIKDMAVSEDIFLAQADEILKFNKGRKQDFALEKSATAFEIEKIYTRFGSQNIYLLDKNNSRLVKLDLTGQIIAQYHHSAIGNANALTIDEKNSLAYLSHGSEISTFEIK